MSFSGIATYGVSEDQDIRSRDGESSIAEASHSWTEFFEEQMSSLENQISMQIIELECIQNEIDAIRSLSSVSGDQQTSNLRTSRYSKCHPESRRNRCSTDDGIIHDVLKELHKNLAKKNSSTQGLKLDLMRLKRYVLHNTKLNSQKTRVVQGDSVHILRRDSIDGDILGRLDSSDECYNHSCESSLMHNKLLQENNSLKQCLNNIRASVKCCLNSNELSNENTNTQESIEVLTNSICKDLEKLFKLNRQLREDVTLCRQSSSLQNCQKDYTGKYINNSNFDQKSESNNDLPLHSSNVNTPATKSKNKFLGNNKLDGNEESQQEQSKSNTSLKSELLTAQKQLEMFQAKIFEAIQLVYDVEMEMRSEQDLVTMVIAVAEECNALRQEVSYLRKMRQGMKESCANLLEYVLDAEKSLESNGRDVKSLREVVSHLSEMVESSEATTIEETFLYLYSNQLEWVEKLTANVMPQNNIFATEKEGDPTEETAFGHLVNRKTISTQTPEENVALEDMATKLEMCDKSVQLEDPYLCDASNSNYPFNGFCSQPANREIYVVHESQEEFESKLSDEDDDLNITTTSEDIEEKTSCMSSESIKFSTDTKFKSFENLLHSTNCDDNKSIDDEKDDINDQTLNSTDRPGVFPSKKSPRKKLITSESYPKSSVRHHSSKYSKKALREESLLFPQFFPLSEKQQEILDLNDFASTVLGRFISSQLGITDKKPVIFTRAEEENLDLYNMDSCNKSSHLIKDNRIFPLQVNHAEERIAPENVFIKHILNMDTTTALKIMKYFYNFEKNSDIQFKHNPKGNDRKLTYLIHKHFIKNKPISNGGFEQYLMWLPYIVPLSLKMIQKFERVLGTDAFTNIVKYSSTPSRSLPYRATDAFHLSAQEQGAKSLIVGENVLFKTQVNCRDAFNIGSIASASLAVTNESKSLTGSNYVLYEISGDPTVFQTDIKDMNSKEELDCFKVLDVFSQSCNEFFYATSKQFCSAHLLMEKGIAESYFDLDQLPDSAAIFLKDKDSFPFNSSTIFIILLNHLSTQANDIEEKANLREYSIQQIGEVYRTTAQSFCTEIIMESILPLNPIEEIKVQVKAEQTTVKTITLDHSTEDNPTTEPVALELSSEDIIFCRDDIVEEEIVKSSAVNYSTIPNDEGFHSSDELKKEMCTYSNCSQKETYLRDEIAALKENLDQQNAVLQRLKECSDDMGAELIIKDEKIKELENKTTSFSTNMLEGSVNKENGVHEIEDILVQTDPCEAEQFNSLNEELGQLKQEKQHYVAKLSNLNETTKKLKSELQRTISRLKTFKTAASAQMQKQKLQELDVIQAKKQLQDAEQIISVLRVQVEAKSELLNAQVLQSLNADISSTLECQQDQPNCDAFCQTDNIRMESNNDDKDVPKLTKLPCENLCDLMLELKSKLDTIENIFSCECVDGRTNSTSETDELKYDLRDGVLPEHNHDDTILKLLAASTNKIYHSKLQKITTTANFDQRRNSSLSSAIQSSLSEDATEASREQSPASCEQELHKNVGYFNVEQTKRVPDVLQDVEDSTSRQSVPKKKTSQRKSSTARFRKALDKFAYLQNKVPLELKNAKIGLLDDDQLLKK